MKSIFSFKQVKFFTALTIFIVAIVSNIKLQVFTIHFCKNEEPALSIISWNIHDFGPDYKQRQPLIAQELLCEDADIIYLAEFNRTQSQQLDSVLSLKYPYKEMKWTYSPCGNVLYSRYPIEGTHIHTTDVFTYYVRINNKLVRLFCCHLYSTNNVTPDHRYTLDKASDLRTLPAYFKKYLIAQKKRTAETTVIAEQIQSDPIPTLVLGDMNDFSGSPVLNTLQNVGLKDAWWEGGTGFGVTFREGWMRFRLDHILYDSNWELSSIKVVQSDLSDHLPLVGEFSMK